MAQHLTGQKREQILEECFLLQMHLNMSYSEVKRLPVRYRTWFIQRLIRHFEELNKSRKTSTTPQKNTRPDQMISEDAVEKALMQKQKKFFSNL